MKKEDAEEIADFLITSISRLTTVNHILLYELPDNTSETTLEIIKKNSEKIEEYKSLIRSIIKKSEQRNENT